MEFGGEGSRGPVSELGLCRYRPGRGCPPGWPGMKKNDEAKSHHPPHPPIFPAVMSQHLGGIFVLVFATPRLNIEMPGLSHWVSSVFCAHSSGISFSVTDDPQTCVSSLTFTTDLHSCESIRLLDTSAWTGTSNLTGPKLIPSENQLLLRLSPCHFMGTPWLWSFRPNPQPPPDSILCLTPSIWPISKFLGSLCKRYISRT